MSTPDLTQEQHREYQVRAVTDTSLREIAGIGVPLNDPIEVWPGFREQFDAECIFDGLDKAKLAYRHGEVIGKIASHQRSAGSLDIVGKVSQTRTGDEVLTLATDGALDSLSIGFRPMEWREDDTGLVTYTKVLVREFSVVPYPAYASATITDVRSAHPTAPPSEGEPTMTDTLTREELDKSLTETRETLERSIEARLAAFTPGGSEPTVQRSAAEALKAIVDGDETVIREYNELMERAYTGATTADSVVKDSWVGDLTRIFDNTSGGILNFFETGTLPTTGLNIEYGQLKSNTMKFEKQEAEGDDLAYGKVQLETKTAPVETFGGYTELSRQTIERSSLPILNRSVEALARAAGARAKVVTRAAYNTLKTAREGIATNGGVVVLGATLAASTYANWIGAVVDAATKLEAEDLQIDGLLVSASVFKKLATSTFTDGRPIMNVDGPGVNNVGSLRIKGLGGSLVSVDVVCDTGLTGDSAAFANRNALRTYLSPVAQLQDENIINLTKQFSVYRYGAVAAEIPAGIVPVKLAAS